MQDTDINNFPSSVKNNTERNATDPKSFAIFPSTIQPSNSYLSTTPSSFQLLTTTPPFPILKQQCRLSRRELTIYSNSCLLLLLGAQAVDGTKARAEENVTNTRLYGDDVPLGVDRFSKIVSGAAGISYRRKEFVKIMPNYVQHGGLRSYGVDAELAKKTGSDLAADSLVGEWERAYERCPGTKNVAGRKLEIDEEEVGTDPNGTEFIVATKDSPELDTSSLVIGRVVGGMEVVQKLVK
ncbi:Cyclophilin-type peptidyl-prolyl cis-trans isomerase domain [Sesbania bispinosa]|nr:Cyclophilin-type peptidyl-prolyl cis-trans isomerase domain [Sesbania bispinosa]